MKITFTQFKEILVNSGCFTSTKKINYGVILCMISTYHIKQSEELENEGFPHASKYYHEVGTKIRDELSKIGFFEK